MAAQSAVSNMNGNTFGAGAEIGINVSTTTTNEKGDKVRKSTSSISISQPAKKVTALAQWLDNIHLSQLLPPLTELGAEEVEDLCDLDEEDIAGLQMKKLQEKRFRRAVGEIE